MSPSSIQWNAICFFLVVVVASLDFKLETPEFARSLLQVLMNFPLRISRFFCSSQGPFKFALFSSAFLLLLGANSAFFFVIFLFFLAASYAKKTSHPQFKQEKILNFPTIFILKLLSTVQTSQSPSKMHLKTSLFPPFLIPPRLKILVLLFFLLSFCCV